MKLWAVGVGPGAPDLVTLRAAEILRRVPVVFCPLSAMGTTSRALETVRGLLDPARQRIVELAFPMEKDHDELEGDWREIGRRIVETLGDAGPDAEGAFVTLGDVSLYSTFVYVQRILAADAPELLVELVPGIASFSAIAALLGMPYGQGDDRIAILPATYGPERVEAALREFETVILMKVNRVLDEVLDTLEALDLVEQAVFVARCGMPDQEIVTDVRRLRGERPSYFSILLVSKTARPSTLGSATSRAVSPAPSRVVSPATLDGSDPRATCDPGASGPLPPGAVRSTASRAGAAVPGGQLYLVGFGPGNQEHLTLRARQAIGDADVVIGYRTYVHLVGDLVAGKEVHYTGMTEELARARRAVDMAWAGRRVALISSGDVGIYGMAGPALEVLKERGWRRDGAPAVEVVPGVTALSACAAVLGAPVVHDFAGISLSNLLTPWEVIVRRLEAAAAADFVIALYNPRSGRRTQQIVETHRILLRHRRPDTPVGIVKSGLRQGQRVVQTTLADMLNHEIGMLTTILIGNSTTFTWEGLMVTPRGYQHKYTLTTLDGAAAEASEAMMTGARVGIDPFLGQGRRRA